MANTGAGLGELGTGGVLTLSLPSHLNQHGQQLLFSGYIHALEQPSSQPALAEQHAFPASSQRHSSRCIWFTVIHLPLPLCAPGYIQVPWTLLSPVHSGAGAALRNHPPLPSTAACLLSSYIWGWTPPIWSTIARNHRTPCAKKQ